MLKLIKNTVCIVSLITFSNLSFACAQVPSGEQALVNQSPVVQMHALYKVADERPFDPDKLAAFIGEDFVDHDPAPGQASNSDYVVTVFTQLAEGAPDSKHIIEFIEPVGDNKALVRWQYVGTHSGTMFGIPASGNRIDISGMELWEFTDGKVSALWHVEELATLFQQLSAQ